MVDDRRACSYADGDDAIKRKTMRERWGITEGTTGPWENERDISQKTCKCCWESQIDGEGRKMAQL